MKKRHDFHCEHLTVGYDSNVIIQDMNIEIPPEKITVLLGANGCGKSTLLKSMARLLKPQDGQFLLDGKSIHQFQTTELARQLALLPQSPIVPAGITVADLVSRGRFPYQKIFSQLQTKDYEIIAWAMEQMQITDLANRCVDELSGGQRQRVWIALSLAQNTDLLLLDEPTTYLDIAHQIEILDCLKKLNQEKRTTIAVILHDINLSIRYADHIVAIKDGKVLAEGTPTDIITVELMKELYALDSIIIADPETSLPMVVPKAKVS